MELAGSHAEMLCYFAARPHHESMRVETPVPRRSPSSLRRPPCNVILIFEVRACAVMSVYVLWVCGCGVCLQSACVVSRAINHNGCWTMVDKPDHKGGMDARGEPSGLSRRLPARPRLTCHSSH